VIERIHSCVSQPPCRSGRLPRIAISLGGANGFGTDQGTAEEAGCRRGDVSADLPALVLRQRLCAPIDKNGDNPRALSLPSHYVVGTLTTMSATIPNSTGLKTSYQLGLLTADLANPVFLFRLVSAGPRVISPPPPFRATTVSFSSQGTIPQAVAAASGLDIS